MSGRFTIEVPEDARQRLASGWLALALVSLALSGVYSILLVFSRAPVTKDWFPLVDFFQTALVVHVDLSVLVWFVAFGGVFWSLNSTPRLLGAGWAALATAVAGTALMAVAPFAAEGRPIMANYIPVLDQPVFLVGLLVFGFAVLLVVLRGMATVPRVGVVLEQGAALRFGLNTSLVSAAMALIAFAWSWLAAPEVPDPKAYYELLFWGGGHVLQFTWTLLMFAAWLWLADASRVPVPLSPRMVLLLFGIGLVSVFLTPVIYLAYDVGTVEHHRWHTWLMRFGGGLAILPFMLALAMGLWRPPPAAGGERAPRAAILGSLLLFGAGGVIGVLIHGSNVRIPAHYHGSIVGVTLAFMGLAYHLLPRFGYGEVSDRWASRQLWIYAWGQLLHVLGLVWSGGYGVQRKVAGADQVLRGWEQTAAMGVMGIGGLFAIIGGMLFLVLMFGAMLRKGGAPPRNAAARGG